MTPNIILIDATAQVKYFILHSYHLLYYLLLKNNCIEYDIKVIFHVLYSLNIVFWKIRRLTYIIITHT